MPDQPAAFSPTQHAAPDDGMAPFSGCGQPPGTAGHVTWSVSSLCHLVGTRPYATRRYDRPQLAGPAPLTVTEPIR